MPLSRRLVRTTFCLGLALLGPLALGGCGFRPMYGKASLSPAVAGQLRSVAVSTVPGRLGQVFRNALIDRVSSGQTAVNPRYRLEAKIVRSEFSSLVQSDASITRFVVTVEAPFRLYDLTTNQPILSESARVLTSYDVPVSEYAAVVAQNDADQRAARELADEISLRLGSFLETRQQLAAPVIGNDPAPAPQTMPLDGASPIPAPNPPALP